MFNIKSYFVNNLHNITLVKNNQPFPTSGEFFIENIDDHILNNLNKIETEFIPLVNNEFYLIGFLETNQIKKSIKEKKLTTKIIKNFFNVLNLNQLNSIEDIITFIKENDIKNNHIYIIDDNYTLIGYIPLYLVNLLVNNMYMYYFIYALNYLNEAMIIIDKNSYILWVNDIYCNMLEVPKYKIIGKFLIDIEPDAAILNVINTGRIINNYEIYIKSLNQKVVANIFPITINNDIIGAISIFNKVKSIKFNEQIYFTSKNKKYIIGKSKPFREQIKLADKVLKTDAPVLITGETGTGKELFAHYIHENSIRRNGPFIPINCAAIPSELFEAELFGYEQGAFTGAKSKGHKGKFYQANGGTLFLDEISELPPSLQSKLLRVTQYMEYSPLGSEKIIKVNVRLISATNVNLKESLDSGNFRRDLYYRLNIFEINLPPLRERSEDIMLLANYYLNLFNKKYNLHLSFDNDIINIFKNYSWPGNIRELENCIYHAIVVAEGNTITLDDLPEYIISNVMHRNLKSKRLDIEKDEIIKTLTHSRTITEAIERLGISRGTFYSRIKNFNINAKELIASSLIS